jgi:hypothetical protein
MKALLLTFVLAQGADITTSLVGLHHGCVELNPVLGTSPSATGSTGGGGGEAAGLASTGATAGLIRSTVLAAGGGAVGTCAEGFGTLGVGWAASPGSGTSYKLGGGRAGPGFSSPALIATGVVIPLGVDVASLTNFVGYVVWCLWLIAMAVTLWRTKRTAVAARRMVAASVA